MYNNLVNAKGKDCFCSRKVLGKAAGEKVSIGEIDTETNKFLAMRMIKQSDVVCFKELIFRLHHSMNVGIDD